MLPARRLILFSAAVLAALTAVLAVLLPAGIASAASRPAAGNRVSAFSLAAPAHVRADHLVPADQRLGEPAPCPFCPSGACVAPEEDIPALVYRGGSAEAKNLTPRPGLDPTGLSTYDNPAAAAPNGGKVQIINTSRLKCVIACPDAPPPGHVSLQPPDLAEIPGWAATRGTEEISLYTQDIMDAIIGITRVPRP